MRVAILLAAPLVMGFAPAQQVSAQSEATPALALTFDIPDNSRAAPLPAGDLAEAVKRRDCRDTIEHARAENGQPPLEQRDEEVPMALLYKAVDHHVDGCDVLVMAGNPNNIRPVPKGGPVRVLRSTSVPEAAPAR